MEVPSDEQREVLVAVAWLVVVRGGVICSLHETGNTLTVAPGWFACVVEEPESEAKPETNEGQQEEPGTKEGQEEEEPGPKEGQEEEEPGTKEGQQDEELPTRAWRQAEPQG